MNSGGEHRIGRRDVLKMGFAAAAALMVPGRALALVSPPAAGRRTLSFYNTHTGEELDSCYWRDGAYLAEPLARIDHILRDHRAEAAIAMDRGLLDLLFALRKRLGTSEPFHVISGYRSPQTNAILRKRGSGVAKGSLHLAGKAVDVRVPGVPLARLRDAALALRGGGVGFYRQSAFVHVDVGRVRHW